MKQFISKFRLGKFERTYHNQAMNMQDAKTAAIEADSMRGWRFDSIEAVQ